ncbi:MAG: response regulator [Balneolaceae bacterium]
MQVLIVEDDLIISLVLDRMVHQLGHEVLEKVTTGENAIKIARQNQPDLILMDIRLAGDLDGIETMMEIHKENQIPVIYITGNNDNRNRLRAEETNFIDFLIKPISIEELEQCMVDAAKPQTRG